VGICDVQDVNVIAKAGAIGCGIVRSEDVDMGQVSGGCVQDTRNQVGLRAMMFAALGGSTRSIKIAEAGVLKSGICAIVRQYALEDQLGFSIGIDGRLGMVLGYGNDLRLAIRGGRGGKNELAHAVAGHGVEQIYAAGYVGGVKDTRLLHSLGNQRFA